MDYDGDSNIKGIEDLRLIDIWVMTRVSRNLDIRDPAQPGTSGTGTCTTTEVLSFNDHGTMREGM